MYKNASRNRSERLGIYRLLLTVSAIVCSCGLWSPPASAAPFAYVTVQGDGTTPSSVSVIDTATKAVVQSIPVGVAPYGVAVTPNGAYVYVTNAGPGGTQGTVSIIRTADNTAVATIAVGLNPVAVSFTPDGAYAYVTNFGANDISVISTATMQVVGGSPLTPAIADSSANALTDPTSVALWEDGLKAFVSNYNDGSVSVINSSNVSSEALATTIPMPNGDTPNNVVMMPNFRTAYVADMTGNAVVMIDPVNNVLTGTPIPVGTTPVALTLTPDGRYLYVTNYGSGDVSVIDTRSNTVVAGAPATTPIVVGPNPTGIAITPDGRSAYATSASGTYVAVIDTTTKAVSQISTGAATTNTNHVAIAPLAPPQVAVGTSPVSVAVNAVTNKIYTVNQGASSVSVIDGATGSVTAAVAVGGGAYGIAVNPVTDKVYVANQSSAPSGSVTVIDGATNTATATVAAGINPRIIAVNPVTNQVYVANSGDDRVTIIDGATNTATNVVTEANAAAVAVNPATNKIYVADSSALALSVIDASNGNNTLTFGTGAPAGATPIAIAVNPATNLVYVVNQSLSSTPGSSTLTVFDGAGNAVVTNIPVGSIASAVALNPVTNRIYVANTGDDSVSVIDGATNTVSATVDVGANPTGLGVDATTNHIYVTNFASAGNAGITVIDGATNTTMGLASSVGPNGVGVNPVTDKVYVANTGNTGEVGGNTVTVVDASLNAISTAASGLLDTGSLAINPVTNKIYVGATNLIVIDGSGAVAPVTIPVNVPGPAGAGISDAHLVAVNPFTNQIYAATLTNNQNTFAVIDGSTNTATAIPVGVGPQLGVAINPVSNRVYVTNNGDNTVTVIDAANGNSTSTVTVGAGPYGIAVNPASNQIFVCNTTAGTVSVIDGTTNQPVVPDIGVGTYPALIDIDSASGKAYVVNNQSNSVSIIDSASNFQVTTVPLPVAAAQPNGIAVNQVTHKVYVTIPTFPSAVVIIDPANNYATTTVTLLGASPQLQSIAVNPATNKIYVTDTTNGSLIVVDGITNAVTSLPFNQAFIVGINPLSDVAYVTDGNLGGVAALTDRPVQKVSINTAIGALPGNQSSSPTPSFNLTPTSSFGPITPPVNEVYYQVDTWQGPWSAASPAATGTYTATLATGLSVGTHIIYAYATDGQDATSTQTTPQSNPVVGNIAGYQFLVVPNLSLSPSNLTFAFNQGGSAPSAQTFSVSSSTGEVSFTAAVSTTSGGSWLSVSPTSGTTPATLSVSVNPTGLAAGTYNGSVSIASTGAGNSPQTVAVTFTVTAPLNLTVSPGTMSFAFTQGGSVPTAQNLTVASSGAALSFTATTATTSGGSWLSVSPTSGTTGTATGTLSVSVIPTGLAAGTYNGSVSIASTGAANSPQTVAVTFTVTAPLNLTVSPSTMSFAFTQGGSVPTAQNLTVGSSGAALSFTATTATTSGGSWLSVSPTSGTTGTATGTLSVSVIPTGLAAGTYNGSVSIASTGAGNSPQTVAVTLAVTQAPKITSANAATFSVETAGSFTVTTTGFPTPVLTESGALPTGLTFNATTGLLSGVPGLGTGGIYPITFSASNGVGATAVQSFTLVVVAEILPKITSAAAATVEVNRSLTFTVTATGVPTPVLTARIAVGPLLTATSTPISFTDNHNGTATLYVAPAIATAGVRNLVFTATGAGGAPFAAVQAFTLTISNPTHPLITQVSGSVPAYVPPTGCFVIGCIGVTPPADLVFIEGVVGSSTITASGVPTPHFTETGALPRGVTFVDNGDGTATLSGMPDSATVGNTYTFTVRATNNSGLNGTAVSFPVTVNLYCKPAVDVRPSITSAAAATVEVNRSLTFTVTATGVPTPVLTARTAVGPLLTATSTPISFTDNHNGTATLYVAPTIATAGVRNLVFTATGAGGAPFAAVQAFTLTISNPTHPLITQVSGSVPAYVPPTGCFAIGCIGVTPPADLVFIEGVVGSSTITASGVPTPHFTETGALPMGVTFVDNGDGTATLSGMPDSATVGNTYTFTVRATNNSGLNGAAVSFPVTVNLVVF
jgi:YVTN family beta-propeller protein